MSSGPYPTPLISVIVPVYNVAGYVGACLASLQAQSLRDFEVILVDDGSTDDSAAQAQAAITDDARFVLIRQPNGGLSAARNTGLARARGAFIAFVDSDDRVAPDYLSCLHAALADSGADWIACAIRLDHPDGTHTTHSAIHGAPALADPPDMRLYQLDNWCQVIPHFPSAWNKLYRRSLIEGIRFDEGMLWEDHAFFHRCAARTHTLAYLPRALYWHRRGRDGQITAADDDGVFQQIDVLETVAGIFAASTRPGAQTALARLASRLGFERATTLRDPDRRARFAREMAAFMARHALQWDADWDADIARAWGIELQGIPPLEVILPWDGQPDPLRDTATSLRDAPPGSRVTLVISDPGLEPRARTALDAAGLTRAQILHSPTPGPGGARNAGLAASRAALVLFLDAGDRVMPGALAQWTEAMLRDGADLGVSRFRVGHGAQAPVHWGFHDTRTLPPDGPPQGPLPLDPASALNLHAHPSAKIFRRAFLSTNNLRFGTGPLPEWQLTLGAALCAEKILYFDWPGVESGESPAARRQWRTPARGRDLIALIQTLPAALPTGSADRLPAGWQRRLLARALWEKLSFAETGKNTRRWRKLGVLWGLMRHDFGPRDAPLDPYISDEVTALMRRR